MSRKAKPTVRLGTQTTVRQTKITKVKGNTKPATLGEKTILKYYCGIETTLNSFRESLVYHYERKLANAIDAAIKRAVKDAWYSSEKHAYHTEKGEHLNARNVVTKIERKYGVKL